MPCPVPACFIAIPLALKLKLERIYPVDDHTGDRATGPIDEAAWAANMKRVWNNPHAETRHKLDKQALDQAVVKARKAADTGVYYRLMIEHVRKVLADPGRVCPEYDPAQGYEIAGFVWLQGEIGELVAKASAA